MKRLTPFMILVSFTVVLDKAFNHGQFATRVADTAVDARDWAVRSGDEVAGTFLDFRGS